MRTRDLEGRWYDVFADWTAADQAAALKVLEALHRQKLREERARLEAAHDAGIKARTGSPGNARALGDEEVGR